MKSSAKSRQGVGKRVARSGSFIISDRFVAAERKERRDEHSTMRLPDVDVAAIAREVAASHTARGRDAAATPPTAASAAPRDGDGDGDGDGATRGCQRDVYDVITPAAEGVAAENDENAAPVATAGSVASMAKAFETAASAGARGGAMPKPGTRLIARRASLSPLKNEPPATNVEPPPPPPAVDATAADALARIAALERTVQEQRDVIASTTSERAAVRAHRASRGGGGGGGGGGGDDAGAGADRDRDRSSSKRRASSHRAAAAAAVDINRRDDDRARDVYAHVGALAERVAALERANEDAERRASGWADAASIATSRAVLLEDAVESLSRRLNARVDDAAEAAHAAAAAAARLENRAAAESGDATRRVAAAIEALDARVATRISTVADAVEDERSRAREAVIALRARVEAAESATAAFAAAAATADDSAKKNAQTAAEAVRDEMAATARRELQRTRDDAREEWAKDQAAVAEALNAAIARLAEKVDARTAAAATAAESGAFYLTLVPIRPRWRGERRFLRTFAGASLRPPLAFNARPRRLSTPLLTPLNSTPTSSLCIQRPSAAAEATTATTELSKARIKLTAVEEKLKARVAAEEGHELAANEAWMRVVRAEKRAAVIEARCAETEARVADARRAAELALECARECADGVNVAERVLADAGDAVAASAKAVASAEALERRVAEGEARASTRATLVETAVADAIDAVADQLGAFKADVAVKMDGAEAATAKAAALAERISSDAAACAADAAAAREHATVAAEASTDMSAATTTSLTASERCERLTVRAEAAAVNAHAVAVAAVKDSDAFTRATRSAIDAMTVRVAAAKEAAREAIEQSEDVATLTRVAVRDAIAGIRTDAVGVVVDAKRQTAAFDGAFRAAAADRARAIAALKSAETMQRKVAAMIETKADEEKRRRELEDALATAEASRREIATSPMPWRGNSGDTCNGYDAAVTPSPSSKRAESELRSVGRTLREKSAEVEALRAQLEAANATGNGGFNAFSVAWNGFKGTSRRGSRFGFAVDEGAVDDAAAAATPTPRERSPSAAAWDWESPVIAAVDRLTRATPTPPPPPRSPPRGTWKLSEMSETSDAIARRIDRRAASAMRAMRSPGDCRSDAVAASAKEDDAPPPKPKPKASPLPIAMFSPPEVVEKEEKGGGDDDGGGV